MLGALLLVLGSSGALTGDRDAPPNILLVVLDDVGVHDVDFLGLASEPAPTPRMSAMASEGIVFRQVVSEPNCSPSRAAILTGLRPVHSGVLSVNQNQFPMSFEDWTIPELLPEPYTSAAIGKWHLSANNQGTDAPLAHGFDHASVAWANIPSYYAFDKYVNGVEVGETTYATTVQANDALAWIEEQTSPWFCYLAFSAAHEPFQSPPPALTLPLSPFQGGALNPRNRFREMIGALDLELARLLDALDPETLARTTILIVGDNGTPPEVVAPEWSPKTAKGSVYQGGVHVPLLVWGAGVEAPGSTCDALVEVNDLFATVLELAGAEQGPGGADSFSLVPYLTDPERSSKRSQTFVHRQKPVPGEGTYTDSTAVRELDLKYHRTASAERLFDLAADPLEKSDLVHEPAYAASLVHLRHLTDAVLASPGLSAFPAAIEVLEGGQQELLAVDESRFADAVYWILGSATAGEALVVLDRFTVPIVPDAYTWHTLVRPNSPPFDANLGALASDATARVTWSIGPGRLAHLAGRTLWHVALVFGPAGNVAAVRGPVELALR